MLTQRNTANITQISGRNSSEGALLNWLIFASFCYVLPTANLGKYGIWIILFALCWIIASQFMFRFRIQLTKHHIKIQKTFLGIAYYKIDFSFESVEVPNTSQVYFYNVLDELCLTSIDPFQGDYLQIKQGKKRLEFGNEKMANWALEGLRKGLGELGNKVYA